jgi:ATP-dependent DNA ligase
MKNTNDLHVLYIKSGSKKRFWKIWIEQIKNSIYIKRKYGIIGGKITIPDPKEFKTYNKAKTALHSLWRKKKESGFSESNNPNNKSLTIKPMGAHKLDDHYNKIIYPACVQTKLDGFRCLANKNELYSKGMKKFVFLHHIKKEIAKIKELNMNIYLDGELYEHDLKLHDISSLVMKKYASQEDENKMKKISYYIFDMFDLSSIHIDPFSVRYEKLSNIFSKYKFKYLKLIKCTLVHSYDEIKNINDKYIYDGYEGVIVRNLNGLYKLNSKSYDVLRTKEFKRKLFTIVSAKEGSGTQKGAIIWQLKCLNSSKTFWGIPIGTIQDRIKKYKTYISDPSLYNGKKAMVKYLDLDNKDGCVSRNPIVEYIVNL